MSAARTTIIAEIASAHEGDPEFARRLWRLACATGADAVKFQIFRRAALMSRVHPKYESFGQIEIAPEDWRAILKEAGQGPAEIVAEIYDEDSLALAQESGVVAAYKIPTSDIGNRALVRAAVATGRRLFLAVGGAREDEIAEAVSWLSDAKAQAVLLHGFQAYPTRIEDTHLARLPALRERYGLAVGYADHVDAEDRELARLVPAMAIAAGASAIEKHITEDRARKGRDHYSALDPAEFADFVALIRRIEQAMGSADPALGEAEVRYRNEMKKQAVAARALSVGARLGRGDVAFKRIGGPGLAPDGLEPLLGRALRAAKQPDDPLQAEDFSP
ncbi:MAG: N-acetylneuraminate synthase family protein [Alphaproteobacteria bacterium]